MAGLDLPPFGLSFYGNVLHTSVQFLFITPLLFKSPRSQPCFQTFLLVRLYAKFPFDRYRDDLTDL